MRLLAGRSGQILNRHSLGSDVGVSAHTVDHWLSILEASFVIFRLPPYFENFGKRAIKSPKVYFCDVGLLVYLLGIETPEQVARDPLVGGIFENLIVAECLKNETNKGRAPQLYFFRDNKGLEVDLLLANGRQLIGVEIKASSTPRADHFSGLNAFAKRAHPLYRKVVAYSGSTQVYSDGSRHVNFMEIDELCEKADRNL